MSEVADADSHLRVNRRIVRNTVAVNYLGLCAITMPVGRDRAGMPVGLQLTAPAHAEEKLLTIALAAEQVLGTARTGLARRRCSPRDATDRQIPSSARGSQIALSQALSGISNHWER